MSLWKRKRVYPSTIPHAVRLESQAGPATDGVWCREAEHRSYVDLRFEPDCMFLPTLRRSVAATMSTHASSAPFSRAVVRAMQKL